MRLQTVVIATKNGPVTINSVDFDENKHKKATDAMIKKAEKDRLKADQPEDNK